MGELKIFDLKGDLELLRNSLTLQELSECCVCMHSLNPSHSLCETGHGICGKCKPVLTQCPMCKGKFVLDNAVLLNQILELLPKPCKYHNQGCTFAGCSKDHEEFCIFRPMQCRVINCKFEGTVNDVINHVKFAHRNKILEIFSNVKKSGQLLFKNQSSHSISYTPVFYEGNFFWKYCHKDRAKKLLVHTFYHVPFAKPTKSYVLKVEFDKLKEKLSCPSQVESTTTNKSQTPLTPIEKDVKNPELSVEAMQQVSDSTTKIKVEISDETLDTLVFLRSPDVEQKMEFSDELKAKTVDCFEKNDLLVSTSKLSRKRNKMGGYYYNYFMSIEEENIFED